MSQNELEDLNQTLKTKNKTANSNNIINYDFNSDKGGPFCNEPKEQYAVLKDTASKIV